MNTSLSIFARALATENLSFSFDANAPTASFDTKTRHLIMPVWDVSDTLQTMLVAHEISHALWTPQDRADVLFAEAEKQGYNPALLHRVCNVVEDVRIERMMKEKYPGTRRDFFLGYREIIDKDMFGLSGMDFNGMNLANRLNIHFKWGVPGFLSIDLTADEQMFAQMVNACESFDDCFMVAKAIYDHESMDQARQQAEAEGKGEGNEGKNREQGEPTDSPTSSSKVIDVCGDIAKKDGETFTASTITISPVKNYADQINTTADLIWQYERYIGRNDSSPALNMESYRSFVRESDAFVRQLVAQFERRKAADEIRRERPKQTGMLNLDRLHQYRTHDDIFLSKIVKQDGKNHGIVFMIDFSGSMGMRLSDSVLQVLQLVWFCEKAKIPFEVFAFTDGYLMGKRGEQFDRELKAARMDAEAKGESFIIDSDNLNFSSFIPTLNNPKPNSVTMGNAKLFTLASSRDSAADREKLLAYLYESYVTKTRGGVISLGGTPTVECLILASQFMQKWVKDNNIQIPTIMVVTDGEPNGIRLHNDESESLPWLINHENQMVTVINEITGTIHRVDTSLNTSNNLCNAIVGTMLDAMNETLGVRRVGMYVGPHTMNENNFNHFCVSGKEWNEARKARKGYYIGSITDSERYKAVSVAYRDNNVLLLPKDKYPGYDAFFLIKTPKIVKDEDAILESGNFTKVKNTFVKTMGKRAGSRVFLTRYVDIVAGQPIRGQDDSIYRLPFLKAQS